MKHAGLFGGLLGASGFWLLLALSCSDPAARHAAQTRQLLQALALPASQDSARTALPDYFFTLSDLPLLYEALQASYPDDSLLGGDTRLALLDIVAGLPAPENSAELQRLYYATDSLPRVRTGLLEALARQDTPEARAALLTLLRETAPEAGIDWSQALAPLAGQAAGLQALFPSCLDRLDQPGLGPALIHLLAEGLQQGHLEPATMAPHSAALLAYHTQSLAPQRRTQLPPVPASGPEADFLRVAAHLARDARFNQLLQNSLTSSPLPSRLAALNACLEVGIPVSDSLLTDLAAAPAIRTPLYHLLASLGQSHRFPAAYAHPAAMAAGDLSLWLARRDYDASAPEAVGSFPLRDDQGQLYAFRFRHRGRWTLGFSGPQPADSSRYETGGYLTGSTFQPYVPYRLNRDLRQYLASQDAAHLLPAD